MTPQAISAKADLDHQLKQGSGEISIALGSSLYDEMGKAGFIQWGKCRAIALNREILWTMYGHGRYVHSDWSLAPYAFVVGKSGITP